MKILLTSCLIILISTTALADEKLFEIPRSVAGQCVKDRRALGRCNNSLAAYKERACAPAVEESLLGRIGPLVVIITAVVAVAGGVALGVGLSDATR